ncbi:hypothetical protein DFQ27_001532, partial [Actinomortierella ambigua]
KSLQKHHPLKTLKIGTLYSNIMLASSKTAMINNTDTVVPCNPQRLCSAVGMLVDVVSRYERMASRAILYYFASPPIPASGNTSNIQTFINSWERFGNTAAQKKNYIRQLCQHLMRHFAGNPVRQRGQPKEFRTMADAIYNAFSADPSVFTAAVLPAIDRNRYGWPDFFLMMGVTLGNRLYAHWNVQARAMSKKLDDIDSPFSTNSKNPLQNFCDLRERFETSEKPVLVPMSTGSHGFVTMTERMLLCVLNPNAEFSKAVRFAVGEDPALGGLRDAQLKSALQELPPGLALSRILAPVHIKRFKEQPTPSTRIRGYRAGHMTVLQECHQSLIGTVIHANSTPRYALSGSFTTNGHALHVHAFDRLVIKKFGTAFPDLNSATPPGRTNIHWGNGRYLRGINKTYLAPSDVRKSFP